jgi:hypothetical protein
MLEGLRQFSEPLIDARDLDFLETHPIHSGRTLIGAAASVGVA